MALVDRFDPPAFLPDFNQIPGQLDAWHRAVRNWFDLSIKTDLPLVHGGQFQFYNPSEIDPGGAAIEQAITWNAFPKELLRQYGRQRALEEADKLWTLDRYYVDLQAVPVSKARFPALFKTPFRPLDEYCEWRVVRDPISNKVRRVTFTSEPPEFWYALFGGKMPGDDNEFPGDQHRLLQLYRELVSPDVQLDDLIAKEDIIGPGGPFALKSHYNPYNKWNTTHGIAHLNAPPNSLTAEIQLGADATILRADATGGLLVEPDALICCAGYGGPDRNSDPTIGAAVNALARLGALVTLKNPVGLYMDHIDLSGWAAPDGGDVFEYVRVIRGMPQMIERLVVEVPEERGFTLGDVTIGGVPIAYGGQIAECITVKLIGLANPQNPAIVNAPTRCERRCRIDPAYAVSLKRPLKISEALPPGTEQAYVNQGLTEGAPVPSSPDIVRVEGGSKVQQRNVMRRRHVSDSTEGAVS